MTRYFKRLISNNIYIRVMVSQNLMNLLEENRGNTNLSIIFLNRSNKKQNKK